MLKLIHTLQVHLELSRAPRIDTYASKSSSLF